MMFVSSTRRNLIRGWSFIVAVAFVALSSRCTTTDAFVPTSSSVRSSIPSSSSSSLLVPKPLYGLFDSWGAGGSGKNRLDEEWEKQQEILKMRRAPKAQRDAYFKQIEMQREQASKKQSEMWAWQTKTYGKGEDPINEWKKRRADGTISDLENQYGDPKKIGGIPLPSASFGVGGEFGVGGKFDNGGRFDLRLPYADQGYVDEDSDFMGKLFGKKKSSPPSPPATKKATPTKKQEEKPKKKGGWSF